MKDQIIASDISALITFMSSEMNERKDVLAALDSITGDGDMGVTVVLCFRAMKKAINRTDGMNISEILALLSEAVGENAPSTFGTLVAAMLIGMSDELIGSSSVGASEYAAALNAAAGKVMLRGRAKLGDKTLLDALIPAAKAVELEAKAGKTLGECAARAVSEAVAGAAQAQEMKAATGRAGYMGERAKGSKDPGAEAIAMMLASFCEFVQE